MIDNKSFSDRDLKRYWVKGDRSRVDPRLHEALDDYLSTMRADRTMRTVGSFPGYHPWPNTPKGAKQVHSLPLSGNQRLLFHFDRERGYFFKVHIYDPHRKGGKTAKR